MPWCSIGDSPPFLVDSKSDCTAANGKIVSAPGGADTPGADAGTGAGDTSAKDCFVRNVLTRGLGELILDLGFADEITPQLAANVDIPREAKPRKAGGRRTLTLSATLRMRLATRAMRSILKLAPTYQTGLDFRRYVDMETPRGRQLLDDYERYLPEIYRIARNDFTLLNDLGAAWLEVHSFVKAMVTVKVRGADAPATAKRRALSNRSYQKGRDLFRRFGEAAEDDGFRALTRELDAELVGYRGLNAEQAIAKFVASPATTRAQSA
jgi:hypothetical protein